MFTQKSTRRLTLSAETLASSCLRLFSQDRNEETLSVQEDVMGRKLQDLKHWFGSTFVELLRSVEFDLDVDKKINTVLCVGGTRCLLIG